MQRRLTFLFPPCKPTFFSWRSRGDKGRVKGGKIHRYRQNNYPLPASPDGGQPSARYKQVPVARQQGRGNHFTIVKTIPQKITDYSDDY
jgi:hypothetical protein